MTLGMVTNGRLRTVMAALEIQRADQYLVLHVPAGAAGFTRSGEHGGPRGRLLLPGTWDGGFMPRRWVRQDMVMVHRFSESWSTWRWLSHAGTWVEGSYVNLERR